MSVNSVFAPRSEPARSIYESLTAEQAHRGKRLVEEWILAERQAVHRAATTAARSLGLREPTMAEVEVAETLACGHVDYSAKFVYGVVDAMRRRDG